MSHQDEKIIVNHQTIKQVVNCLLPVSLFAGVRVRKGATWKRRMLAATALLWATSHPQTLGERFVLGRKIVKKVFRGNPSPGESYQGFMKMLRKWHAELKVAIIPHVRAQMLETLPDQGKIAGYTVFAGDGSRIELPRTESIEKEFSPRAKKHKRPRSSRVRGGQKPKVKRPRTTVKMQAAKTQSAESIAKKTNSPQMWLTLLWRVGSGLPWAWRTGPSNSSEREHLTEMLPELPKNSLITADAGFVGYDFWKTILDHQHHLVIRVGANVRLLKQLGCARQYEHTVYLWPDAQAKQKQPPLALRLIVIHNGKHPVYLVTNLTKSQLSDRQAGDIYAARWGIELFFRTFKQTFGCRKLRSHSAKNATLELDWALLGLWCICLLGQRELAAESTHPSWLSAATAIKAFQDLLCHYRVRPDGPDEHFWTRLALATLDDYNRVSSKTSRNYPRKKTGHAIGKPKIELASKQQINAAKQLRQTITQFQLSA